MIEFVVIITLEDDNKSQELETEMINKGFNTITKIDKTNESYKLPKNAFRIESGNTYDSVYESIHEVATNINDKLKAVICPCQGTMIYP